MFSLNKKIRLLVAVAACFMPWQIKRIMYTKILRYEVHKDASIGFSFIFVENLQLAKNARIGHLNICKGLKKLEIEESGSIGQMNWISCNDRANNYELADDHNQGKQLKVGKHGAITLRHYIDCSGGVVVGEFSILAGVRSQILTHSVDFKENKQKIAPVVIGSYCFIGSGSVLLSGSSVPNNCLLGAGSVLTKPLHDEWCLYAGSPAVKKKKISRAHKYFFREIGYIT